MSHPNPNPGQPTAAEIIDRLGFRTPTAELSSIEVPCAICVLGAMRQGVPYGETPLAEIVGQPYGDGRTIHASVTVLAGTEVCWYHVDDAAKAAGL